jgi:lysophospholipase L1-like esterase
MTGTAGGQGPGNANVPAGSGWWKNALLLGISCLLGVVLGEAALHLIQYSYSPLSVQVEHGSQDHRRYHAFEDGHFEFDPELIWAPKRGSGVFNADGYRGPRVSTPKPEGEFRILAVGDSNTLGWDGPDGPNWPAYLGEELGALGDGFKVLNAGVWGYSSHQGLRRLRRYLDLGPDLVLVSFGSNDALAVSVSDRDFQAGSGLRYGALRWLTGFRIGQLGVAVLEGLSGRAAAAQTTRRVTIADYRENLRRMIRLVRERGASVALLTRPYIGEASKPGWWKMEGADYNAATMEVAANEGVLAIDVYTVFKDAHSLFADESHFTEEGHRAAASFIRRSLLPLLGPPADELLAVARRSLIEPASGSLAPSSE